MNLPEKFTPKTIDSLPLGYIINTMHRQHHISLKHRLKNYGITPGEYPFIVLLSKKGPKTQQEIANHFYLTEGTVARTLNKLEEKKIITKKIDEKNRRKKIVSITTKGKKINQKVKNIELKWDNEICNFLSFEENKKFRKILYQLTKNILESNNKLK